MRTRQASSLLCLGLAACTLNARPGDGLVTDDVSQSYDFGSASQGGGTPGGRMPEDVERLECKNLPLFVQQVQPHFIERCVECHDGTKLKAVLAFDLIDGEGVDEAGQKYTCSETLTKAVNFQDRLQSTLFTEVDPARTDLEHEFKYPDGASFTAFRDAVMIWLQAE